MTIITCITTRTRVAHVIAGRTDITLHEVALFTLLTYVGGVAFLASRRAYRAGSTVKEVSRQAA